jgi:hypothetical protein
MTFLRSRRGLTFCKFYLGLYLLSGIYAVTCVAFFGPAETCERASSGRRGRMTMARFSEEQMVASPSGPSARGELRAGVRLHVSMRVEDTASGRRSPEAASVNHADGRARSDGTRQPWNPFTGTESRPAFHSRRFAQK